MSNFVKFSVTLFLLSGFTMLLLACTPKIHPREEHHWQLSINVELYFHHIELFYQPAP